MKTFIRSDYDTTSEFCVQYDPKNNFFTPKIHYITLKIKVKMPNSRSVNDTVECDV